MEILGLDIGGSGIKGAPVDVMTGELTRPRHRVSTPKMPDADQIAEEVADLVEHFQWQGPIGCAFPARVKKGVVRTASNISKSCIGVNVAQLFSDTVGQQVFVVNDADAAGIAEIAFGAGRDRDDLILLLTVGTGIGSALFLNQMLIANTELGHIRIKGRDGERYAADSARKRDDLSWKQWSSRFNRYLKRIEFLLHPDLIILGGGISNPKKKDLYFKYLKPEAELVTAELGNRAGIVGAAMFAASCLKRASEVPMPELPAR